jgi:hypothetical protein
VGREPLDTDSLPDYGRIAARFEQIATQAQRAGKHGFAERLHACAGQMREDLDRSPFEIQLGR